MKDAKCSHCHEEFHPNAYQCTKCGKPHGVASRELRDVLLMVAISAVVTMALIYVIGQTVRSDIDHALRDLEMKRATAVESANSHR